MSLSYPDALAYLFPRVTQIKFGLDATRTLLGKAEIILWRLHDAPAYRVECGRSFAPYVYAFLREAAREFA